MIREISLVISLCLATSLIYKNKISFGKLIKLKTLTLLYILFIVWAFIVAIFISPDALWSLREIKVQWIMGSLVIVLGIELALLISNGILSSTKIFLILFLALLGHVVFINADGIYTVIKNRDNYMGLTFLTRNVKGLTIGPIGGSVVVNFLITMLLAELFLRVVYKKAYLPINYFLLISGFFLSITASFFCGMRNIVEILSVVTLSVFILLLSKSFKDKILLISFSIFLLSFIFIGFFKSDSRWTTLTKSVELAWNTDYNWNQKSEGDYLMEPVKGEQVSRSNYIRFEKYKDSINIIKDNPLGIGFGRNAFGHGLKAKYDKATGLNADSTVLDIFIGTGLIGGILGILIYLNLFWIAIAYFKKYQDFIGFWLLLVLISFGSRMVVDSILDHMLQQFMFITSLLIVLTIKGKGEI